MPRIPLYNQGQGPAVQLATGPLSRRADVGAFTAPGQALASFGEKASQIAFQFGEAEKKAETERVYAEKLSEFGQQADELITNPTAKTVRGFEIEAGEFKNGALAQIDGLDGLTNSQKQTIKNGLSKSLDRKLSIGRASVFSRQQADRSLAINQGIRTLISDAANLQMRDMALSDIDGLIASGREQGLKLSYDENSVRFEILQNDGLADSINPNYKVNDLKEKRDKILRGEDEFASYDADQRSKLARPYKQRINELEFGEVARLKANEEDLLARIKDTGDTDGLGAIVQAYRDLDREDLALNLESNAYVGKASFEFIDDIAFATDAQVSSRLEEINALPIDGPTAAENARIKEFANKAAADRRDLIQNDPAQYVAGQLARQNKEVTPQSILSHQKMMGIPLRPFTNTQAQQTLDTLKKTDSEFERVDILNQFAAMAGEDNRGLVLSLMPSAGFSMADMFVAADPLNVMNYSMLAAQKVQDTELNALIKARNYDPANINQLALQELDEYVNATIAGGSQSILARTASSQAASHILSLQETVSKTARYLVAFNNMSEADAAVQAARIINDKYVYPTVNGKTFVMPRKYELLQADIQNELTSLLMDDKTLANVEVGIYAGDVTGEISRERYRQNIRSGGRWATDAGRESVVLLDNVENVVVDETTGLPIKFSFAELQSRIQTREKAVEQEKFTISSTRSQLEEVEKQLKNNFTGQDINNAKDIGGETLEQFNLKMEELKTRREMLQAMLKSLQGRD